MNTMKKLLLVLAVGAFVACNNGSTETKTDSTTSTTTDSATVTPAPTTTDSANHATDSSSVKPDSTKK